MKGLLRKDFLLLRAYGRSLLLLLVLFLGIGVTSGTNITVGIVMIESIMLSVSTFSYDDMAKWNAYMLSMPVSRKTAVREKYVFALLLGLIGIVLSLLAGLLAGAIRGNIDWRELGWTVGACLTIAFLYLSIMMPLAFRYGAEKMRILLLAVFFVLFFILFGGYVLLSKSAPGALASLMRLWPIFPVLMVASLSISYVISQRIFEKKEIF